MLERSKAEQLSDDQLDRELLKRDKHLEYEDERESFESYCQNQDLFPDESPAKHHAFMCGALQLVEQGEIKRLMVLMPPGHGKSVYCSVRFPGKHPKHHLIHAMYGGRACEPQRAQGAQPAAQPGLRRGGLLQWLNSKTQLYPIDLNELSSAIIRSTAFPSTDPRVAGIITR
jgi:hypothetical protein